MDEEVRNLTRALEDYSEKKEYLELAENGVTAESLIRGFQYDMDIDLSFELQAAIERAAEDMLPELNARLLEVATKHFKDAEEELRIAQDRLKEIL